MGRCSKTSTTFSIFSTQNWCTGNITGVILLTLEIFLQEMHHSGGGLFACLRFSIWFVCYKRIRMYTGFPEWTVVGMFFNSGLCYKACSQSGNF